MPTVFGTFGTSMLFPGVSWLLLGNSSVSHLELAMAWPWHSIVACPEPEFWHSLIEADAMYYLLRLCHHQETLFLPWENQCQTQPQQGPILSLGPGGRCSLKPLCRLGRKPHPQEPTRFPGRGKAALWLQEGLVHGDHCLSGHAELHSLPPSSNNLGDSIHSNSSSHLCFPDMAQRTWCVRRMLFPKTGVTSDTSSSSRQ